MSAYSNTRMKAPFDERFDVGFVDSPQGYVLARKVLPGCEDCNRLNTTLYALDRCKVVYLHDIHRDLEWNTLGRLNRFGWRIETSGGKFAKILGVASLEGGRVA